MLVFLAKAEYRACAVPCCMLYPVCLCRIAQQEVWLNKQVAAHPSDPFWQVVGLLQAQLDGLYEGYAAAIAAARDAGHDIELLSRDDVLFMNSNGEQRRPARGGGRSNHSKCCRGSSPSMNRHAVTLCTVFFATACAKLVVCRL